MKKTLPYNLFWLNISFLFIATSGALGKWITLPPELAIFWRSFLAIPFLIAFLLLGKQNLRPLFKWNFPLVLSSVFMGIHWVTYFYALQWSNVATGMLSLFTFPIMTAFLEPIFFKTSLNRKHLLLGGLTFLGIYFLVPSFTLVSSYGWALLLGLFSALCYALRNLMIKKYIPAVNGSQLMLKQVIVISLLFTPFLSVETIIESMNYGWALLFLALFTTVIGHSLFLYSLNHFSVTTASMMACIQPLYGIILAYFFLNEIPHWGTYVGGALILFAVFVEARSLRKE